VVSAASESPRYRSARLPRPTRTALARRGWQLGSIFTRQLAPLALDLAARRRPINVAVWAPPLRRALEQSGGTFVKFGQIVASSSGLFGEVLSEEFRSCLDTGPPVAFADVRAVVEDELGADLHELFASFEPVPIGRASIAVVHKATLPDGTEVAVKVLRPRIAEQVATDLDLMEPLFALLVRHTGDQLAGATLQQLDGLRQQIGEELDLRNEVRALEHFAALVKESGLDQLVVPRPYPALSSRSVLTMEYLDGVPIDDVEVLGRLGRDPSRIVEQLIQAFFVTTLRWRTFHGDLHAGNLLLLGDGRVGVIDWGIVGRLDEATHRYFCRVLAAALGDESAWGDVAAHLSSIYGPAIKTAVGLDDEQLGQFLRMMIEPVLLKPFGEFSIAEMMVMTQVQVAKAHGVTYQGRSVRELYRRLRLQRRIHSMALAGGGLMSEFDRSNFLLGKQLMYFERYGRLYLGGRAILDDRSFFTELLTAVDPDNYDGRTQQGES
jgi:predicted unusual protein kinase regulating ubiquinone biosynthesis (AarF/ABC1/UbiB family)